MSNSDTKYTFIDLFAGIGGFHIAMNFAGLKCVNLIAKDKLVEK